MAAHAKGFWLAIVSKDAIFQQGLQSMAKIQNGVSRKQVLFWFSFCICLPLYPFFG
jgi:hypothetical protein